MAKQYSWNEYVRYFADYHGISYPVALREAGPSFQNYKEQFKQKQTAQAQPQKRQMEEVHPKSSESKAKRRVVVDESSSDEETVVYVKKHRKQPKVKKHKKVVYVQEESSEDDASAEDEYE